MLEQLQEVSQAVAAYIESSAFTQDLMPEDLKIATEIYPKRAGKMMRPALLTWCCGVFDDDTTRAIPAAAAVELFHTWTLVHDDIIDEDDSRRGGPAAHSLIRQMRAGAPGSKKFGRDMAILAGDVQQAWANSLILNADISAQLKVALLQRLNDFVNPTLITGEAMDVEFELRWFQDISLDEMETMLRYKTGILLRFAAEAGAMIGLDVTDHADPRVKTLGDFAEDVGFAFQLRDDVLGMFGDEERIGKPVGSDLRQGKRNYLFTCAVRRLGDDAPRFLRLLGDHDDESCYAQACTLLERCGALGETESRIHAVITSLEKALADLPQNRYTQQIVKLAEFACTRDH